VRERGTNVLAAIDREKGLISIPYWPDLCIARFVEFGVKTLKGSYMSKTIPMRSQPATASLHQFSQLSDRRRRAFTLNQQRLRWAQCGRRVAERMNSIHYGVSPITHLLSTAHFQL